MIHGESLLSRQGGVNEVPDIVQTFARSDKRNMAIPRKMRETLGRWRDLFPLIDWANPL
jgi:hypothetical protein